MPLLNYLHSGLVQKADDYRCQQGAGQPLNRNTEKTVHQKPISYVMCALAGETPAYPGLFQLPDVERQAFCVCAAQFDLLHF